MRAQQSPADPFCQQEAQLQQHTRYTHEQTDMLPQAHMNMYSSPPPTCASLFLLRFSSTSLLAMGKLRSIDSNALRVITITRTVLRDLRGQRARQPTQQVFQTPTIGQHKLYTWCLCCQQKFCEPVPTAPHPGFVPQGIMLTNT
jgi:hypothetical protein